MLAATITAIGARSANARRRVGEANRARIEAENARTDALVAMELEKARLEAMPKIVSEMVKPAEKIKSINVNHVTGLGGSGGKDSAKTPVGSAMDSIMEMAVQMPLLKKIGDQMGVSFDDALEPENKKKKKD